MFKNQLENAPQFALRKSDSILSIVSMNLAEDLLKQKTALEEKVLEQAEQLTEQAEQMTVLQLENQKLKQKAFLKQSVNHKEEVALREMRMAIKKQQLQLTETKEYMKCVENEYTVELKKTTPIRRV